MSNRIAHGPGIRAIREALGITLRQFAADLDISPGHASLVENGKRPASDALIAAMASRLGVSVDAITVPGSAAA